MTQEKLDRILMVEDDPSIREVVELALVDVGGFTLLQCASGAEALASAEAFSPQLLLIDVMMPGMDGPTTLRALRDLPRTAATPAIFMTAKVQPGEVARYREIGAVDVIAKPFKAMTLADQVRAIWARIPTAPQAPPPESAGQRAEARLAQLGAEYRLQLDGHLASLESAVVDLDCAGEEQRRAIFNVILNDAHKLAGSGATFGYVTVSALGATLETLMVPLAAGRAAATSEQSAQIGALVAALRQAAGIPDERAMAPVNTVAANDATGSTLPTILLGPTDPGLADELRADLAPYGYSIELVGDRLRLSALSENARPLAVLWDMDHDTGFGVAAIRPDVPLILLGQAADMTQRLTAARAGAIGFLGKPIDVRHLLDLVGRGYDDHEPPLRVLIVDDDVALSRAYAAALEQVGMQAVVVNDPMQTLDAAGALGPDLIVLDVHMPGVTGLDVAKVIRQHPGYIGVPILFLSAAVDLNTQLAARSLGGDDFMMKPLQPIQLVSAVTSRGMRYRELRRLMEHDPLTGALNHSSIMDRLSQSVESARRGGGQVAFAVIDVDLFKRVNDRFGHPVGDTVLKALARLLKRRLRAADAVGRMGGEEFALVLPGSGAADATRIVDDLRSSYGRIRHFSTDGEEFSVTFSAGVAAFPAHVDARSLIEAADSALYRAKRSGRDRVETADPT
jgi:diguanylate cyclase (GGDEF)-like protein